MDLRPAAAFLLLITSVPAAAQAQTGAPAAAHRVVVHMTDDNRFTAARLTVSAGDTIVFVNDGQQPHTATDTPGPGRSAMWNTLPSGAAPWDSGLVNAAGRYTVVLTVPGRYNYHCAFHASMGMVASVTVRSAR